jgi:hypothetical protein
MKNVGLHLDGLLFKKAEIDASGKTICLYDCGFLAGPVQDGMLAQFGKDSFSTLKSETLPGGSPALCLRQKREFSKFILPPWAIWKRIRTNEPKNRKWSCQSSVGRFIEVDLEEHLGRLIKAEVSPVGGKGALIVDDDLELSAQDRLLRYIGKDIDLLPKSVACVLSYIRGKQNHQLVELEGKKVLVLSLGMEMASFTKVTLRWLDEDWEETDSVTNGYLVPEIEQKDERVLPPLCYIPMDVYSAVSSKKYFEEANERLNNLWVHQISSLLEHPHLHWGPTGWHEDFSLTPTTFDDGAISQILDMLGTEKQNKVFSPKIIKEHLETILPIDELDFILISDQSHGLLSGEFLIGLQKSLSVTSELVTEEISLGALDFLEKQDLGKPTYRERLPDIFIRGQREGSRPDWFPLVKSEGDFAHGGREYNQKMDFRAAIEPYKENVLINLKMGEEESEANLKKAELIFNSPSKEKIVFDINVQVKASQGYGVVSLLPTNSEEFRKKNGDIILDWQKLEQGFIEEDSGLAAPPANEIECLNYDNQNSCYDNILNAFAVLTVKVEKSTINEIKRYLIDPAQGIHPNMQNGLTFGSNPKAGIEQLVLQGWSESPEEVWDEFLEFNETLKILWENLGSFNIAERSQLKDWIARAGSHLWSDTQEFIIEYLSNKIQSSRAVQFIEAAGRSFHDPDSVKIFIEQFKHVGWERTKEVDDPFNVKKTLGMQHWFKALSFIFRTNDPVYKWVPSFQIQTISKIFRYQVWCEWKKFKKEQLEQALAADLFGNQTNFPTNLSSPLRQTFLACLYALRLREENFDLFGLTATAGSLKQDQEFARKLYQVLFESWLHIPWFEPSEHLAQRVINTSLITPTPSKWFLYLFLWPEEQEVFSETELLEKYDLALDLEIMDSGQSLSELLSDYENEGWITKKDNGWEIDAMPSQWKSAFLYEDKIRKPIQIKIARFLLKKADNSDLTITGMFTDVFS